MRVRYKAEGTRRALDRRRSRPTPRRQPSAEAPRLRPRGRQLPTNSVMLLHDIREWRRGVGRQARQSGGILSCIPTIFYRRKGTSQSYPSRTRAEDKIVVIRAAIVTPGVR